MAAPASAFPMPAPDTHPGTWTPEQHRNWRAVYVDGDRRAIAAHRAASAATVPATAPVAAAVPASTSSGAQAPSGAPVARRHPRQWTPAEHAAFRKEHRIDA